MSILERCLSLGLGLALLIPVASANAADFAQNHPARAKGIARDHNLRNRINNKNLTGKQKATDKARVNSIAADQHRDQALNGGHLTAGEAERLNSRRNALSTTIKNQ